MSLIHNTKHAYIHLKMAENHLKCIEHQLGNYTNNKFRNLQTANEKMFKSIERELIKNGEFEEIEEMLIKFHDIIDGI